MAEVNDHGGDASQVLELVTYLKDKLNCDRYMCQELLASTSTNYLLSADDPKKSSESPCGLISQLEIPKDNHMILLLPKDNGLTLNMREVHQIIRELTIGIFVFNQIPSITLEPNADESCSCQLPIAYHDTLVGQILIEIDYTVKALWHGAYFSKASRIKFMENWKADHNINQYKDLNDLMGRFTNSGMIDISEDEEYLHAYDELEQFYSECDVKQRQIFSNKANEISVGLNCGLKSVQHVENIYIAESEWSIYGSVLSHDEEMYDVRTDKSCYQSLAEQLQHHRISIQQHLADKVDISYKLHLFKLISFLVPLFVALKRSSKIPNLYHLLPWMTGDEVKTEKDLPPLIIGSEMRCQNFSPTFSYVHLHGGIHTDCSSPDITNADSQFLNMYEYIQKFEREFNESILKQNVELQTFCPAPDIDVAGRIYHILGLDLQSFYSKNPQQIWIKTAQDEIMKFRSKRLPMSEVQISEQFKKYLGLEKAAEIRKNLFTTLREAARRGMVAAFSSISCKLPASHLSKFDDDGMTLIHEAAMFNKPDIISILARSNIDINVKRKLAKSVGSGPTPLCMAARCGSLDALCCLVSAGARMDRADCHGWFPVHCAAFYDQPHVLQWIIRRFPDSIEIQTNNSSSMTPLLLACSSGAVACVKCLIDQGADVTSLDSDGNDIILLAALGYHTNVLEFLVAWNQPEVNVWRTLVDILNCDDASRQLSGVKCMSVLSSDCKDCWRDLLMYDALVPLIGILRTDDNDIKLITLTVLSNISNNLPVCETLTRTSHSIQTLVEILSASDPNCQLHAAVILADLGLIEENRMEIAKLGGIEALVSLLGSMQEETLVAALTAVRVLCIDSSHNQSAVQAAGAVPHLVEFLSMPSDIQQACAADALAALTKGHKRNQNFVLTEGTESKCATRFLTVILSGHVLECRMKAALAVETLAEDNDSAQEEFIELGVTTELIKLLKIKVLASRQFSTSKGQRGTTKFQIKNLLTRQLNRLGQYLNADANTDIWLLQMFSLEAKEQAASALWSLAGSFRARQKFMSEQIGLLFLIDMLLSDSDLLQYVGCSGMLALGWEDLENQNMITEQGGAHALIRLLGLHTTSHRTILKAVRALAALCIGVAYQTNTVTQDAIAEDGAIHLLVGLFVHGYHQGSLILIHHVLSSGQPTAINALNEENLKTEAAYCLGCLVLNNKKNQERLAEEELFDFQILVDLFNSNFEETCLKAGFALSVFTINSTALQLSLRQAAGLHINRFDILLSSAEGRVRAAAAFQMAILSRVVIGSDHVTMTARSIKCLTNILQSEDDDSVLYAAGLISSLAYVRPGLTDAMVTLDIVPLLLEKLVKSTNNIVKHCSAVALGYLSFNRTACRILLSLCRNQPLQYRSLIQHIGTDGFISEEFTSEYERNLSVGLPRLPGLTKKVTVIPSSAATGSSLTLGSRRPKSGAECAGRSSSALRPVTSSSSSERLTDRPRESRTLLSS